METQLCLIFCTHWAHLAEHFIERSPTPSRAFASETSSRTSCRSDTSSPVPRWCVPRPILVLLAHRRPPRSLLPPADQHHLRSSHQAAGAYYAPAAYKLYEAESEVTAAERSLSDLETREKTYDGDIARAKAAVKRGAAEFAAARAEAVRAAKKKRGISVKAESPSSF